MPRPVPRNRAILSSQVSGSRYFFLDLGPAERGDLSLVYGGFEQCNPDYLIQRDGFVYEVIEFVAAGAGTVVLNGRATPLRPGSIYGYSTRTRLEIRADPARPMAKYFLCFTGARAAERVRQAGVEPNRVHHLALFPEVQSLLDDLLREGQHHRRLTPRLCAALAEVLLLKIRELTRLTGRRSDAAEESFLRCKGLIDTRTDRLQTLGQIATEAGLESSQLCRLFRRYQGLSPYQYLLRRKMTLAGELLMDSHCLVKEAAARVGFSDPYHFSRCFKKIHGLSPKEFQLSLQRV